LLALRAVIGQAVEQGRQEKIIGNALEAEVTLSIADPVLYDALSDLGSELEEFFILSDLKLVDARVDAEASAVLGATEHHKCQRCWRHRPAVGLSLSYPDLCDRCEDAVSRQLADAARELS
jgi:isoleucyl-tRNA synthetase